MVRNITHFLPQQWKDIRSVGDAEAEAEAGPISWAETDEIANIFFLESAV